jgi:hypothetical protein
MTALLAALAGLLRLLAGILAATLLLTALLSTLILVLSHCALSFLKAPVRGPTPDDGCGSCARPAYSRLDTQPVKFHSV